MNTVSFLASTLNPYVTSHRRLDHLIFSLQGGGIFIDGSADLTDCNIHDNVANLVSFLLKSNPLRSVPWSPAEVGRMAGDSTLRARHR